MTHVAAGVLVQDGAFLVCQRRAGDAFGLKWEFPGGKLHDGETPESALVRELQEELGILADIGTQLWDETYMYENNQMFRITFFHVPSWEGELQPGAFEQITWSERHQLTDYDFLEADLDFIRNLKKGAVLS